MSRLAPLTLIAAVVTIAGGLQAAPAAAQDVHVRHYDHARDPAWRAPSWRDQRDRPGDYRCDAYWDANRDDCHESWRDQRPRYAREVHGGGYVHYGRGHGYGGHHHGRYADTARGASAWPGAYGRPDLVYPATGHGYAGARDPRRIEWCRWNYRSYDPASGYYRAYSGRLVYCG